MSLWLDDDLAAVVEAARIQGGKDRSTFVRDAIVEYLQARGYPLPANAGVAGRNREELNVPALTTALAKGRSDPARVAARAAIQKPAKGVSKISAA